MKSAKFGWWAVIALAAMTFGSAQAQQRPSIPEPRCTTVTLVVVPGHGADAREVGIRVINSDPGDFPARLHTEVELEQEVDGRWQRAGVTLQLRATCQDAAADCVTIAPRSEFSIVPWTGILGDAQCGCLRCTPAPAAPYRFAVNSCARCQSPVRTVSAPFDLPPVP